MSLKSTRAGVAIFVSAWARVSTFRLYLSLSTNGHDDAHRGCVHLPFISPPLVTPNTTSTPHRSTILPQSPPPTSQRPPPSVATLTMSGHPLAYVKCEHGSAVDTLISQRPTSMLSVLALHQPDPTANSSSFSFPNRSYRSSDFFVPTCCFQTHSRVVNFLLPFDSFCTPGRVKGLTGRSRSFKVCRSPVYDRVSTLVLITNPYSISEASQSPGRPAATLPSQTTRPSPSIAP